MDVSATTWRLLRPALAPLAGLLWFVTTSWSCGGTSPASLAQSSATAPTETTPAPVARPTVATVFDETSGRPIAGARVVLLGREGVTDASGEVTLEVIEPPPRTEISIEKDGYLRPRKTWLSTGPRFGLIPILAPANENMIGWMAWNGNSFLVRGEPGQVFVYLPPDLATPEFVSAMRAGAAQATGLTQGAVTFEVVTTRPGGDAVVFDVAVDARVAEVGAAAWCERFFKDGQTSTIGGGRIVYARRDTIGDQRLARHELGHALGLGHNPDPGVMNTNGGYSFGDFTDAEKYAARIVYLRKPDTDWQDDETRALRRNGVATAGSQRQHRIVCFQP
jgi:hypothetical protein